MIVIFLKDTKLGKNVIAKAGSRQRLKNELAKKLWLKDSIEILGKHDFVKPLKKEDKKED